MDIKLKKAYTPSHQENKMKHEGDVVRARNNFYEKGKRGNLYFLIKSRFEWMNQFIQEDEVGLEVGCGTGVSKEFIKCRHYSISDFTDFDFLDYRNINALETGFKDSSYDFIIASNMIHHIPYPVRFFEEMSRILKPGGKLIIQEVNGSWSMRFLLRLMKHEGYNYSVDVFNKNEISTSENDLWSGNDVIPNLLFDNLTEFKNRVGYFNCIHHSFSEFLIFLNSGGVIAKTRHIPLPLVLLKALNLVDKMLIRLAPQFFALQRQIVLINTKN